MLQSTWHRTRGRCQRLPYVISHHSAPGLALTLACDAKENPPDRFAALRVSRSYSDAALRASTNSCGLFRSIPAEPSIAGQPGLKSKVASVSHSSRCAGVCRTRNRELSGGESRPPKVGISILRERTSRLDRRDACGNMLRIRPYH